MSAPPLPPLPSVDAVAFDSLTCIASNDYDALTSGQISVQKGDALTDCVQASGKWICGTNERTGKRGLFPTSITTTQTSSAASSLPLPDATDSNSMNSSGKTRKRSSSDKESPNITVSSSIDSTVERERRRTRARSREQGSLDRIQSHEQLDSFNSDDEESDDNDNRLRALTVSPQRSSSQQRRKHRDGSSRRQSFGGPEEAPDVSILLSANSRSKKSANDSSAADSKKNDEDALDRLFALHIDRRYDEVKSGLHSLPKEQKKRFKEMVKEHKRKTQENQALDDEVPPPPPGLPPTTQQRQQPETSSSSSSSSRPSLRRKHSSSTLSSANKPSTRSRSPSRSRSRSGTTSETSAAHQETPPPPPPPSLPQSGPGDIETELAARLVASELSRHSSLDHAADDDRDESTTTSESLSSTERSFVHSLAQMQDSPAGKWVREKLSEIERREALLTERERALQQREDELNELLRAAKEKSEMDRLKQWTGKLANKQSQPSSPSSSGVVNGSVAAAAAPAASPASPASPAPSSAASNDNNTTPSNRSGPPLTSNRRSQTLSPRSMTTALNSAFANAADADAQQPSSSSHTAESALSLPSVPASSATAAAPPPGKQTRTSVSANTSPRTSTGLSATTSPRHSLAALAASQASLDAPSQSLSSSGLMHRKRASSSAASSIRDFVASGFRRRSSSKPVPIEESGQSASNPALDRMLEEVTEETEEHPSTTTSSSSVAATASAAGSLPSQPSGAADRESASDRVSGSVPLSVGTGAGTTVDSSSVVPQPSSSEPQPHPAAPTPAALAAVPQINLKKSGLIKDQGSGKELSRSTSLRKKGSIFLSRMRGKDSSSSTTNLADFTLTRTDDGPMSARMAPLSSRGRSGTATSPAEAGLLLNTPRGDSSSGGRDSPRSARSNPHTEIAVPFSSAQKAAELRSTNRRRNSTEIRSKPTRVLSRAAAAALMQAAWRGRVQRRLYARVIRQRFRIAREVLDTERTYVLGLRAVKVMYLEPCKQDLRENPKHCVLSQDEVATVFQNIEQILAGNEQFWKALERRMKRWHLESEIGDLFLDMTKTLGTYQQYISNYDEADRCVKRHRSKRTPFEGLMRKAQADPTCGGLDLESLLIYPVQRIPRYILLLADLIKHTPETHCDHANLVKAREQIQALAVDINAKKRDTDTVRTLQTLTRQIKFPDDPGYSLVAEGRSFIERYTVTLVGGSGSSTAGDTADDQPTPSSYLTGRMCRLRPQRLTRRERAELAAAKKNTGSRAERTLFLFSDSIVLCRPATASLTSKTHKFVCEWRVRLADIDYRPLPPLAQYFPTRPTAEQKAARKREREKERLRALQEAMASTDDQGYSINVQTMPDHDVESDDEEDGDLLGAELVETRLSSTFPFAEGTRRLLTTTKKAVLEDDQLCMRLGQAMNAHQIIHQRGDVHRPHEIAISTIFSSAVLNGLFAGSTAIRYNPEQRLDLVDEEDKEGVCLFRVVNGTVSVSPGRAESAALVGCVDRVFGQGRVIGCLGYLEMIARQKPKDPVIDEDEEDEEEEGEEDEDEEDEESDDDSNEADQGDGAANGGGRGRPRSSVPGSSGGRADYLERLKERLADAALDRTDDFEDYQAFSPTVARAAPVPEPLSEPFGHHSLPASTTVLRLSVSQVKRAILGSPSLAQRLARLAALECAHLLQHLPSPSQVIKDDDGAAKQNQQLAAVGNVSARASKSAAAAAAAASSSRPDRKLPDPTDVFSPSFDGRGPLSAVAACALFELPLASVSASHLLTKIDSVPAVLRASGRRRTAGSGGGGDVAVAGRLCRVGPWICFVGRFFDAEVRRVEYGAHLTVTESSSSGQQVLINVDPTGGPLLFSRQGSQTQLGSTGSGRMVRPAQATESTDATLRGKKLSKFFGEAAAVSGADGPVPGVPAAAGAAAAAPGSGGSGPPASTALAGTGTGGGGGVGKGPGAAAGPGPGVAGADGGSSPVLSSAKLSKFFGENVSHSHSPPQTLRRAPTVQQQPQAHPHPPPLSDSAKMTTADGNLGAAGSGVGTSSGSRSGSRQQDRTCGACGTLIVATHAVACPSCGQALSTAGRSRSSKRNSIVLNQSLLAGSASPPVSPSSGRKRASSQSLAPRAYTFELSSFDDRRLAAELCMAAREEALSQLSVARARANAAQAAGAAGDATAMTREESALPRPNPAQPFPDMPPYAQLTVRDAVRWTKPHPLTSQQNEQKELATQMRDKRQQYFDATSAGMPRRKPRSSGGLGAHARMAGQTPFVDEARFFTLPNDLFRLDAREWKILLNMCGRTVWLARGQPLFVASLESDDYGFEHRQWSRRARGPDNVHSGGGGVGRVNTDGSLDDGAHSGARVFGVVSGALALMRVRPGVGAEDKNAAFGASSASAGESSGTLPKAAADALAVAAGVEPSYAALGGARPRRLAVLRAGDTFGEMAMLLPGARPSVDCVALADTILHCLDESALHSAAAMVQGTNPLLVAKIYAFLGRSLLKHVREGRRLATHHYCHLSVV